MKTILIGSQVMKHHYPDFPREPKDTDYAVDVDVKSGSQDIEWLYNPILFKYNKGSICGEDNLLTLKISHLFWDTNWEKHLFDTLYLLDKGAEINYAFLDEMIPFWEEYLPKIRRSNLAMTKEDFFTNAVNEDTDQHDYWHTLLNPVPMYTKLLKDGSEVELDPAKWDLLIYEEKKAVVFEETAVMACERYPDMYYKKAFRRQLQANVIKHFPRYIAIWSILNWRDLHITNINFIKIIKTKLKDGLKKD